MIKVRDLLEQNICVDVYDSVCDELAIAFDGPQELTEEGKKHFADVLDYEIRLNSNSGYVVAIVEIGDGDDWEERLEKAKELFYGMAGYCSVENWDKWFV